MEYIPEPPVTEWNSHKTSEEIYAIPYRKEMVSFPEKILFPVESLRSDAKKSPFRDWLFQPTGRRVMAVVLIVIVLGGGSAVIEIGRNFKGKVLGQSEVGYADLSSAVDHLKTQDFNRSGKSFSDAYTAFSDASESLGTGGRLLSTIAGFVPGLSIASSGAAAIEAGKHLAAAGVTLNRAVEILASPASSGRNSSSVSFLSLTNDVENALKEASPELSLAASALSRVNPNDLPESKRAEFLAAKDKVTWLNGATNGFLANSVLLQELLGGNGPRKYLFLLQNNDELRSTGGFIGSYALLEMQDGKVRRFFVDGIFNPDGQLKENIVPPSPIEKISAGWSLHDSNWWPDFPTSARKAISFYEKTGGPTVDGVIAFTPTVMQRILAVIGPIDMPEYGVTVDEHNFVQIVQEQVEEKYDRTENKPKKILNDLSEKVIEKALAEKRPEKFLALSDALLSGINEKHILLYSGNTDIEDRIDAAGWSGRLLSTDGDYVSVVHSNINGYKTDGVIDETIGHRIEIQDDGSVVDTLSVTRKHNGGNTPYDWWNKVNADYMRVYVPLGSKLLSAKGATREFPKPPLDYDALGFHRDADVVRDEANIAIDSASGTRVGVENDKTVFGNWVYVSPGESVTVEYRYLLPIRIDAAAVGSGTAKEFSVLYQKQSGTPGSHLVSDIVWPKSWASIWQTEGDLIPYGGTQHIETDLSVDRFFGVVFGARGSGK